MCSSPVLVMTAALPDSMVGKKPYPAFGQNTNRDYLIYLLSKHNIYFNSIEIDHISMIILSEELSDMSEVKFDN